MKSYIHMILTSISIIYNIAKINRKCLILQKQRIIPRNVLLNAPNNPSSSRLRRAATKNLNPAKPNPKNPIELPSSASSFPFEYNLRVIPRQTLRRRGIIGENWGFPISVAKIMVKNKVRTRLDFG